MKVVLEGITEGSDATPFRKEFVIESVTDARDRWILIDEHGEGQLMLTGEELAEIGGHNGVSDR